jgi:hypothetical protein
MINTIVILLVAAFMSFKGNDKQKIEKRIPDQKKLLQN